MDNCPPTPKWLLKSSQTEKSPQQAASSFAWMRPPFDCSIVGRDEAAFFKSSLSPLAGELRAFRRWRHAPDVARQTDPDLRPLRSIAMPGTRLEIAELFVGHAVEVMEQLDQMPVGIAMIDRRVVAGAVTHRSPENGKLVTGEMVARLLHMDRAAQLERDMMQAMAGRPSKIQRMMLVAAAHEDEAILDPIGDP